MCIGIPMHVQAVEPGHALCQGRGERRRVRTALVGEAGGGRVGCWSSSTAPVERITAARANEISSVLDLLQGCGRRPRGRPG